MVNTLKRLGGAIFIGSSIVSYISILFARLKHCQTLHCEPWSFFGIPLIFGLIIYLLFGFINFIQKRTSLPEVGRPKEKRAENSTKRRLKFIGGTVFILSLVGTISIIYFRLPVTIFTEAFLMLGFGGIFMGSSLFVLCSILK